MIDKISIGYEIFGLKDSRWQEFEKNKNYTAFLVKRKV